MARTLRKIVPWLALAGVALLPTRAGPRRPRDTAAERPTRPASALKDAPASDRDTLEPSEMFDAARGRLAEAPQDIPAPGWKDILIRTGKEFSEDQVPLVAAGFTFYALLAMFPALASFVALYGLFADVAQVQDHLQALTVVIPADMLRFVGEQMMRISAASEGGLSLAFVGGLLLSVWSASGATRALITAMNIAYDEVEKRGFVRRTLISLAFTLGFLAFGLCAVAVIAAPPAIERVLGPSTAFGFRLVTWPVLLAALGTGLALLYRFGPSRDQARWRWISWGSAVALVLWMAASAAFSVYVANFAHYERTYGSLGAAVGFMMWMYVSGQVILLGAELNSEIEHQTAKDTTVGPEKPLGARGAVMADTVGAKQGR
ncbi:YihY/virulence factor BrkB family protein [Phenylobacterium sp. J367]|uniref:YihY/virulence factor BrkB family protein n=1 Tax=Phenylobacterium sp. J367 TaxID=2898435 RepID=UPI0021507A85|nr:YihY/virulence factor BrkB family protein [Phenylobacterium sp. J367]MCR5880524.1 YihY/virulence factor BrkB family protein [Phenylobacterium sp. J367]